MHTNFSASVVRSLFSNIRQKCYEKWVRQITGSKLIGTTSPYLIWGCLPVRETNIYRANQCLPWCSDTKSIISYYFNFALHKENFFFLIKKILLGEYCKRNVKKQRNSSQYFSENNAFVIKTLALPPFSSGVPEIYQEFQIWADEKINKKQISNAEVSNWTYMCCMNLWLIKQYYKTSMYHSAGNSTI